MKVLVAEDDLASGKFMQKLLSKYGEVVLARDGIAAVDEFVNAVSMCASGGGRRVYEACVFERQD